MQSSLQKISSSWYPAQSAKKESPRLFQARRAAGERAASNRCKKKLEKKQGEVVPRKCHNHRMSFTHIIVPAVGLQPFESPTSAFNPAELLAFWKEEAGGRIELHEDSLSMPYEMAYARALEIPSDEGMIPWAALETETLGKPCAWLHPCRLDVGMTDMVMQPTSRLHLNDAESRELLALISPYFEQDGIELRYHSASRWLALGDQFAQFECASLARVQGRSINDFLPDVGEFPQQLKLSRLQAEVQMLLYTHPSTEARLARGLPAVNSFWVDGAGMLEALPSPNGRVSLDMRLRDAAHSESAYRSAWAALLAESQRAATEALERGDTYALTLCGEKAAITVWAEKPGWKHKILSLLGRKPSQNMREQL
jgi:hypothetical protein